MPQFFDPYPPHLDGRRKITAEQVEAIRKRYALGGVSAQKLADQYGVSKSRVLQLVNLEHGEKTAARNREHKRNNRQRGREWADVQARYRAKKRKLGFVKAKSELDDLLE